MAKSVFPTLFLAVLLLAACSAVAPAPETVTVGNGTYRRVSASQLRQMLKNKDFLLINVHIPPATGIAGTDVSIPYDEIGQKLSQLPPDQNARIVLYCRSGHMSSMAAETLVKLGYVNVWELEGGTQAWEAAGYSLQGK